MCCVLSGKWWRCRPVIMMWIFHRREPPLPLNCSARKVKLCHSMLISSLRLGNSYIALRYILSRILTPVIFLTCGAYLYNHTFACWCSNTQCTNSFEGKGMHIFSFSQYDMISLVLHEGRQKSTDLVTIVTVNVLAIPTVRVSLYTAQLCFII